MRVPPWDERDLGAKIRSARRSGRHAVGEKLEQPHMPSGPLSISHSEITEPDAPIAETFPAFHARLCNRVAPADIVPNLIPGSGTTWTHGQPRTFKTWIWMEILRAVTTGGCAFALERFRVRQAMPAWYLTEEDPDIEVDQRLMCCLNGVGTASTSRICT